MNPIKVLFALLPVLSACVQQVELVVGDRQVVVDCILSEAPQQTLYLSWTDGKTGVGPEALEGAVATLTDLTESQLAGEFEHNSEGCWTLDYAAIPEHDYRLEVEVPGYGIVRAEDTMPPAVDVSYARGHFEQLTVKNPDYFVVQNYYNPDQDFSSWYYHPWEIFSVFYQSASLPIHLLIRGFVYDEQKGSHRLSEMLCSDSPGVLNQNLSGTIYGVAGSLEDGDDPVNPFNPLLEGRSCHNQYLRIERERAQQQEYFTISGDFRMPKRGFGYFIEGVNTSPMFVPMSETDDYLLFTALSNNYSRYLDEAALLRRRSESMLLSDRYVRSDLFSNIEGGVGIFGASTAQKLPIDQYYSFKYY